MLSATRRVVNPPGPGALFWVFMGVWVALGIGSTCFFRLCRDTRLKRAVFPWFVLSAGALLALFAVLLTGEPWVLAFAVPGVALVSFLNVRFTKFCDACGAMLYNHAWFTPMRFCPRCGAALVRERDSA
jgi:ribosomal protein S27AE